MLCSLVCSHLVYLHTPRALGGVTCCSVYLARCVLLVLLLYVFCRFFHAAVAIRALQMLAFAVHAALAIGALRVLVVTSLCLFACCSCHQGFANACSEMSVFICMLLLPSGLCRCLNFVVHAAFAIRALHVPSELCRCL